MVIAFIFNILLLLWFTIVGKYSNMRVLANKKAFRKYRRL